jgi:hypothetical protein
VWSLNIDRGLIGAFADPDEGTRVHIADYSLQPLLKESQRSECCNADSMLGSTTLGSLATSYTGSTNLPWHPGPMLAFYTYECVALPSTLHPRVTSPSPTQEASPSFELTSLCRVAAHIRTPLQQHWALQISLSMSKSFEFFPVPSCRQLDLFCVSLFSQVSDVVVWHYRSRCIWITWRRC